MEPNNDLLSKELRIRIINQSLNPNPSYATDGAAGMDVFAANETPILFWPMERKLVPTGLFLEIPEGFEIQLRPRSGWALRTGMTLLNSPATIDSDYRGELQVLLINLGQEPVQIEYGMRIAQLVAAQTIRWNWEVVTELSATLRGGNGFGH
ncbi:MAG: dUTP diphosphatase, partial [Bacteroidia bacterium]|nr:dUTP diphosphatase [Bacteroidia bacterium]